MSIGSWDDFLHSTQHHEGVYDTHGMLIVVSGIHA